MGVIPTLAPYLLPRVLPAVRKALPDLRLLLREDQTGRIVRRLHAGELDLLLLALPVDVGEAVVLPLFSEPFVLAAPKGHPLLARERVREADLAGESVLLLEEGHCLREHALPVCRLAGARENGEIQATSLSTLVQMVENGLGITLLPELAVPVEIRADRDVEIRRFAGTAPAREIGLVWRKTSARGEEFRRFAEFLTPPRRVSGGSPSRTRRRGRTRS
jgi:LysR family hydrogen peroxide-inducible transcriptional activator